MSLGTVLKTRFPLLRHGFTVVDHLDGLGARIGFWDAAIMGMPKPDAATLAQWTAEHVPPPPPVDEIAALEARVAALEALRA